MKKLFVSIIFLFSVILSVQAQSIDTLTIGQNGNHDFKTISAAFDSLYNWGVDNSIILLVTADYIPDDSLYRETFPITVQDIKGTGADTTITLKLTDDINVILKDSADCIFYLDNAKHFSIYGDGRLNIVNESKVNGTAGIRLYGSCDDIVIDGCNIVAEIAASQSYGILVECHFGEYPIVLSNNNISRAIFGLFVMDDSDKNGRDIIIDGNSIGDVRDGYHITSCGICVSVVNSHNWGSNRFVVSDNKIFSVMGGDLPTGITVYDGSGTISNNLIIDIVNNNGQAHGPDAAYGMIIMSSNDSVECYNNMISHVAAGNAYGIYTHTVSSLSEFYYNSIYLCEDNSQYLENVTKSYCFLIDGLDKGSRFFMKNNILLNNFGDIYGQPVTDATCLGIRNVADDLVPLLNNKMNITHNIFYADEMEDGYPVFNMTSDSVYWYYDISAWNTMNNDTTNYDLNPVFTSTSLLMIAESNALGTPIEGITADYFGTERNQWHPDIGACEIANHGISNFADEISLKAYYSNGNIKVSSDKMLEGDMYVVDMAGRVVAYNRICGTSAEIPFSGKSGVYVVVIAGKTNVSRKIFI
ncbi:MAG: hypothetical protein J5603_07950 [Bacteroidales bacterium]|nr:hypothetical protein [Bacteroidales bacterium]